MIVIGIDPGLTGACAVLDHNGLRAVFDLPTMPIPGVGPTAKVKTKIDGRALRRLLLESCPADEPVSAVIEGVGVLPSDRKNNAVQTQGSLMRTLGAVECVLETLGLDVAYASTTTWKKFYGLISPSLTPVQRKRISLDKVRQLYPDAPVKRAKDHNRAEAVLIAHWHLRHAA